MRLAGEGAAAHGRRVRLLEAQREQIPERRRQLTDDLAVVEHKIAHYRGSIESGLDCDGLHVDAATAEM